MRTPTGMSYRLLRRLFEKIFSDGDNIMVKKTDFRIARP